MRELKQGQWLRIAAVNVVLKEDNANAITGKLKDSVREETSVVSGTVKISVQNRHQKPLHPLNHKIEEVEVRRGKRTSGAGVRLGSSLGSRAKTAEMVLAPNHLETVGILPNVNSLMFESGCKFCDKCTFAGRLKDNPAKSRRRTVKKAAVAKLKDVRQLGCVFQDTEPLGIFVDFTEEHKSHGINAMSAIHRSCAALRKHPR